MKTLGVAMIARNEEKCLAECLESVKGADELVVVDTGSSDSTMEIARKYTDLVFEFWGCNQGESKDGYILDFAKGRNYALDLSTTDWVLSIDADEVLGEGEMKRIKELIQWVDDDVVFVDMQSKSHPDHVHKLIRLFQRKENVRWKGECHEVIDRGSGHISDIRIIYGYSETHQKDPDRYLRILQETVRKNPTQARNKYYLAREYFYKNDYELAIYYWSKYMEIATWNPEKADAFVMLSRCYWSLGDLDKAKDMALKAILINPNFAEPFGILTILSTGKERDRWQTFKDLCTNENVLFIRK